MSLCIPLTFEIVSYLPVLDLWPCSVTRHVKDLTLHRKLLIVNQTKEKARFAVLTENAVLLLNDSFDNNSVHGAPVPPDLPEIGDLPGDIEGFPTVLASTFE